MKLVHVDFSRQLEIPRQNAVQWVIESPELFAQYVHDLYYQWGGQDGRFVLVEQDKELDFTKSVEMILNPFSVNLEDKRIITKLYQELQSIAVNEIMYQQTTELMQLLQQYFYELEQQSPYMLTMNQTNDVVPLLKALGVQLECETMDFFETLHLYIRIVAELLKKKLIVFVQIGRYFTPTQRQQLIQTAAHHDISLLFIETQELDYANDVPRYIMDVDGCEI